MAELDLVNIGSQANDGTGDPLRTAFGKVNQNLVALNDEVVGHTHDNRYYTKAEVDALSIRVAATHYPARRSADAVITTFQPGHGYTLPYLRGTITEDTTDYIFGSQSVKLTTEGDSQITSIRSTDLGGIDFSNKWLRVWVKVDDSKAFSELVLYLTSDNFTGYRTYQIAIGGPGNGRTARDNEWFPVTIDLENPTTSTGSTDLSSITHIQLTIYDNGTPINVWFNEIALVPKLPGGVVIVFDDARSGVWSYARPIMEKYGVRGTVAAIASFAGQPGYMTVDQMKRLQKYHGWDIICHQYSDLADGLGYDTMTENELRLEVEALQKWMYDNGFRRGMHHVTYPFGGFNDASIDILKDYFITGRTIIEGHETNPMADPMRLRTILVINSSTVSAITGHIDKALANGTLLILTFHNIVPGTPALETEYNASDFEDIIEHIHNSGIDVKTIPELTMCS